KSAAEMVVGKATTSTSSRALSSCLPPAPMTLGTSTRFLLVATRAPDRRMQSHSGYAYYKPSPRTSSKTSHRRDHRIRNLLQCKCPLMAPSRHVETSCVMAAFGGQRGQAPWCGFDRLALDKKRSSAGA